MNFEDQSVEPDGTRHLITRKAFVPVPEPRLRNFDAIRIAAAVSVILTHALAIADPGHKAAAHALLGSAGVYGVFVFLIVSGYLVTDSFYKASSVQHYLWKRFLRIYPGLASSAILTTFVIAPFYLTVPANVGAQVDYVLSLLSGQLPWFISGVSFYPDSNMGQVINGSVWTIRQEAACYIILAVLCLCGIRGYIPLLAATIAVSIPLAIYGWQPTSDFWLGLKVCLPSFMGGVTMYFVTKRFAPSYKIAAVCAGALVLAVAAGFGVLAFPFLGAYLVIWLGLNQSIDLGKATRYGDLSYGTYLYGWPVEQVVRSVIGPDVTWWQIFFISTPIALGCGWLSWHLVEKHAMRLKRVSGAVQQMRGMVALVMSSGRTRVLVPIALRTRSRAETRSRVRSGRVSSHLDHADS
jgi:peptidoglycan/LPS O-acetylase OafA/YrhL